MRYTRNTAVKAFKAPQKCNIRRTKIRLTARKGGFLFRDQVLKTFDWSARFCYTDFVENSGIKLLFLYLTLYLLVAKICPNMRILCHVGKYQKG